MFTKYLELMSGIYDKMDSIMITNKDGVIEYSVLFDAEDNSMKNEGYTGCRLLDVYPELTEETSSHFRVMRSGQTIIDEVQTLTDFNGRTCTFVSSTYPIEQGGGIIGAIECTVLLSPDGTPYRGREGTAAISQDGQTMFRLSDIITKNPLMKEIKERVALVAEGDSPVLIVGDTGTGKEMIAQALHSHSRRSRGPFISQNCSAIPSGLLESTLFGTKKGSYTGAEDRKGLFELADKGTLFLDELNSMDIELQGKILKAIEEQRIRRIGDEKQFKVDVRIVSAVNQDPFSIIESGRLRRDLYYRLGVVQIRLPLLRERPEDIPILVQHYIDFHNREEGKKITGCSELVEQLFINYSWPGNVRELKNAVEYAYNIMKGDVITVRDLPEHLIYDKKHESSETGEKSWQAALEKNQSINEIVEAYEREILEKTLTASKTVTDTAKALHISRQALQYKMAKYGIEK